MRRRVVMEPTTTVVEERRPRGDGYHDGYGA